MLIYSLAQYSTANSARDYNSTSLKSITLLAMPPTLTTAGTFLLLLVLLLICPHASSSSPLPSGQETGNAVATTGSVVCLTFEARELLVESCHKRALEMHKYAHVSTCFSRALDRLTDNATSNLGYETLTCLDDKQIMDALMNCAFAVDRQDVPGAIRGVTPVAKSVRFFTNTMHASLRTTSPLGLASATKFAQSLVAALKTTARLRRRREKESSCSRTHPCCLLYDASLGLTKSCLREYCHQAIDC